MQTRQVYDFFFQTFKLMWLFFLCSYTAVAMPMLYNTRYSSRRRVTVMISVVWVLSFAISCPLLFGLNNTGKKKSDTVVFFVMCDLIGGAIVLLRCIIHGYIHCTVQHSMYMVDIGKIAYVSFKCLPIFAFTLH